MLDSQYGSSHQANTLCPGQVEEVAEAAEHPDTFLILAEAELVKFTDGQC
jgi:hypothetical protein